MKLLVVDIGNTKVKYAVFEKDKALYSGNTNLNHFAADLKKTIIKFNPAYSLCADVTGKLESFEKVFKDSRLLKWNSKLKIPFANKYQSKTIGQDRLALVAGGQNLFPGQNVLIISAGTCITYDFINRKSEYLGGAISPGLEMRIKALHHFTAKLPIVKLKNQVLLTGNTTQSSILSGVINGAMQEVKGIISQYRNKYEDLKVILTGGNIEYFDAELKNQIFARRHLTLEGLNKILQLNIREE